LLPSAQRKTAAFTAPETGSFFLVGFGDRQFSLQAFFFSLENAQGAAATRLG
jgi:hypothetical protein